MKTISKNKNIFLLFFCCVSINTSIFAAYGENAWFKYFSDLRKNNVVFLNEFISINPVPLEVPFTNKDTLGNIRKHMVSNVKLFTRNGHIDVTKNPKYGTLDAGTYAYYFGDVETDAVVLCGYRAPTSLPDELVLDIEMTNEFQPDKICKFTIYLAPKHVTIQFLVDERMLCTEAGLIRYRYAYTYTDNIVVMNDLTLKSEGNDVDIETFLEAAESCKDGMTVTLKAAETPSAKFNLISGKATINESGLKFYCKGHFKEHDEFDWKIAAGSVELFSQEATEGSQYDKDFTLPPAPWETAKKEGNYQYWFLPEYTTTSQMETRQTITVTMTE